MKDEYEEYDEIEMDSGMELCDWLWLGVTIVLAAAALLAVGVLIVKVIVPMILGA